MAIREAVITDIIEVGQQFYIHAESSLADGLLCAAGNGIETLRMIPASRQKKQFLMA